MKKSKTAYAVRCAVFGAVLTSAAAFADTGSLKVQILDINGNPVAGAQVKASSKDSIASKVAVTDSDGFVRLPALYPSHSYEIVVTRDGYSDVTKKNVKVVSGKNFNLNYVLTKPTDSDIEVISVTSGRYASAVDTTSASTGMDITLDLTDSLPTARNYQSYLQLAPGIKPSSSGNPSSKSGVNYSDTGGVGTSSDNVYYLDGIDTTDNDAGTAGASINSEIIQEQQIFTGAIPAEFAGGSGLVTRVVTKSGSNEFHGSVNYYLQNDSLVADNENLQGAGFSTYDTAVTLGGPIIKDELWFFASLQQKNTERDVVQASTNEYLRSTTDETNLGFGKLTWQATENDNFVISYFDDPRTISGSSSETILANRDLSYKLGGQNLKFEYSHTWDDLIVTFMAAKHTAEDSRISKSIETRNDIVFASGTKPAAADASKGGRGTNSSTNTDREEFHLNAEYYFDTDDFGEHVIKAGISSSTNYNIQDTYYTGSDDKSMYTSLDSTLAGTTLGDYVSKSWVGSKEFVTDDYDRILKGIDASTDKAYLYGLLDTDNDNTISNAELEALTFSSTANNPTGDVDTYRIREVETAAVEMKLEGKAFFIQDQWSYENFNVNLGLRAEKWSHIASTGAEVASMGWDIAPRLSVAYDIGGEGTSKVFGFAGRYYDPVRTNMTDFAGNVTGPVTSEEIKIGEKWVNFRTRGGLSTPDALFAPSTETPYTDEFTLGYANSFAENMSVEVTYTNRVTKNLIEDYDLGVYTQDLAGTDFYLPITYFGYDEIPNSNYVIANLAGGKREYQGIEVSFRKFRADNWQAGLSYTYNDATGNSNSDSNADYAGDVVWLDPKAPGVSGDLPGNIPHQLKGYASYFFDNGLEVGAIYNWNSGSTYTKAESVGGRFFPVREEEAYEFGGVTDFWFQKGLLGSEQTPSYGTLDVRVKYVHNFGDIKTEFFLDIFNVLDDQAVTSEQPLFEGDANYAFGEGNDWVSPRRFYLGARVSF